MSRPGKLTPAQWEDFRTAYAQGRPVTCPQCGTGGDAELHPGRRAVHYPCGHQRALPDDTDTHSRNPTP
ncbi:hypothetical protein ABT160_30115 [Streptomyces sp. NPDC001941]|uniref:hypothetical protein n=1 Tax=Streptomyces sp. NPDC001941 TaxID=3154659 RepID=UPI0033252CBD